MPNKAGINGSPCSPPSPCWISWTVPGHQIESSNTIDGEHCAIWVPVCHHLHHVCDALAPCSGRKCVLEGLGGIESRHELLRKSFCHQPSDDVPDNNSSDPFICLLQRCHLAHSQKGDNFFGKFRQCESLGNFEELGAILNIVEKWAQMLVAHARRASCCSPTSGSQIVEELILIQFQSMRRNCRSDLLWDGVLGSWRAPVNVPQSVRTLLSPKCNRPQARGGPLRFLPDTPKSPHVQLVW